MHDIYSSLNVIWKARPFSSTVDGPAWAMCLRGNGRLVLYNAVSTTDIDTTSGIWRVPQLEGNTVPGNDLAPYKLVMDVSTAACIAQHSTPHQHA